MMEAMPAAQEDNFHDQMAYAVQSLEEGLGGNLVSVVLFGSLARGDEEEGSDWDLLVIAWGLSKRHLERLRGLKEFLPTQCSGRLSILAKTPYEFVAALPTLYLEIALDGLILYDASSFADKRV
jgi:predicted nucleotidyltransferase